MQNVKLMLGCKWLSIIGCGEVKASSLVHVQSSMKPREERFVISSPNFVYLSSRLQGLVR